MTNVILDLPQVIDYASFAIDPSNRCERRAKGVAPRSGLMMLPAAWRYDNGLSRGAAANAAKYLAAEAGFKACQTAVLVHGGYGYAREYHVERYLREMMIPRIAPVSPQLILCFIAEKVLGLPKSY